jgi:hypothetical protein
LKAKKVRIPAIKMQQQLKSPKIASNQTKPPKPTNNCTKFTKISTTQTKKPSKLQQIREYRENTTTTVHANVFKLKVIYELG